MEGKRSGECLGRHSPVELIDKLTLEDRGQALKTLYVINGVIVYSGLVRRLFWEQRSLVAESFIEGATLTFNERDGSLLHYRIADVMRITRAPRYAAWLEQVDLLAQAQWNEYDYTRKSGAHTPGDSWIEQYLDGLSPFEAWEIEMRAALIWDDAPDLVLGAVNAARCSRMSPSGVMR
ncbi:hypothetical protein [Trinickia dinghuensis]|uniref:Uncharacterized protein n=1 Tax=Trinickia dinghuensis TaxID=2291023 RepID=A0A3D8K008_9BURK|nr:hypothetical protein [Trinickia dinghuensis]RDU98757.1 hypothetical protein DWV00_10840 [Trinickia dinghuensis]